MTKKKKTILLSGIITLIAVTAFAFTTSDASAHKPDYNPVRKAIMEAIKVNDYDAFVKAAEGKKIGEIVENEGEFDKLVEAHELRKEARDLMKEIGFKFHKYPHHHWCWHR